MNAQENFKVARVSERFGGFIFGFVVIVSIALIFFKAVEWDEIGNIVLIMLAAAAITCSVVTLIFQTEGNRALRATQLSDALGAGLGEAIRADYYNTTLPVSIRRLGATTLENTLFTKAIVSKMALKERVKNCIYFAILLALFSWRRTPIGCLLVIAQALFSADLVLKLVRVERYRYRTNRVHEQLAQFFLQAGNVDRGNDMAILLAAFADYECAKDEAALPLDQKLFDKLNPRLSREWEALRQRVGIQ